MPVAHRPGRGAACIGAMLFARALLAPDLVAQTQSPPSCPDSGIVVVSVDSLGERLVQELGTSVDTTYTISVDRGRWTWRDHVVEVAAGVRGTAPASWHACSGAWASFRQATVVLENARGRVHVRASLEPLLEVLRRHRSVRRETPRRENQ